VNNRTLKSAGYTKTVITIAVSVYRQLKFPSRFAPECAKLMYDCRLEPTEKKGEPDESTTW
jgi:hypothetical protein